MALISQRKPPEDLDSIILPLEWCISNFKQMMMDRRKEPVYFDGLSHESMPGIRWRVRVHPSGKKDDVDGKAIGVFLCPTFHVSNGDTLLTSEALSATASFRKLQLKGSNGALSPAKDITHSTKFGFCVRSRGKHNLWTHEAAEPYCNVSDGSLTICGEIVVRKHGSRLDEFARRLLASGEYSDLSLVLDARSTDARTLQLHRVIVSFASPLLADLVRRGELANITEGRSEKSVATLILHLYGHSLWFKNLPTLACETFVLSEWFGLSELKQLCLTGFRETLTVTNALDIYLATAERNLEPIKLAAVNFIYRELQDILTSDQWKNLKADSLSKAMELCEQLFLKISDEDLAEPARKRKKTDDTSGPSVDPSLPVAHRALAKVPVSWRIPGFKKLIASNSSECIVCPKTFEHDAYPGIAWTVVLYPKGKSGRKDSVGVYVRQTATSTKKSPATGLSIGFALALHRPNSGTGSLSTLTTNAFHCGADNEIGLDDFCKRALADSRCDRDGALMLSGHFTLQIPTSPLLVHLRRSFDSGADSDFQIIFGGNTFAVHKNVLTRSPKIAAMLATPCTETKENTLKIQAETSVDAVKAMLQFWYDEPLLFHGLPDLTMEVLVLAEEYQDWRLVKICESALLKMIDEDNVLDLAALAFRHKAPDLAKATAGYLAVHTDTMLRHDNETWGKLKDANLELALQIADAVLNVDASFRSDELEDLEEIIIDDILA